jgi:hypothetical protein
MSADPVAVNSGDREVPVDDVLYEAALLVAVARGVSVDEVVARALRRSLAPTDD